MLSIASLISGSLVFLYKSITLRSVGAAPNGSNKTLSLGTASLEEATALSANAASDHLAKPIGLPGLALGAGTALANDSKNELSSGFSGTFAPLTVAVALSTISRKDLVTASLAVAPPLAAASIRSSETF